MTSPTPDEVKALCEKLAAFVEHEQTERGGGRIATYAAIKALEHQARRIEELEKNLRGLELLYRTTAKIGADDHEKAHALITKSQTDHLLLTPLGVECLDQAEATRAERDQLRARVAELEKERSEALGYFMRERNRLADEAERLRAGLGKYGRHTEECHITWDFIPSIDKAPHQCTCGLNAALVSVRGTADNRNPTTEDAHERESREP